MFQQDLPNLQKLLTKIPPGKVSTYGALAKAMKMPKACRYVGYLLKSNPEPDIYPCYKVVRSDGSVGGYSGPGGLKEKIRRLRRDGVIINSGRVKSLKSYVYHDF